MDQPDYDAPIDLHGIAVLLQVGKNTPNQWRQRSSDGTLHPPLPEPLPNLARPIWRTGDIIAWAEKSDPPRWPPGTAGRPYARGPRIRRRGNARIAGPFSTPVKPDVTIMTGTNSAIPPAVFMTTGD